jgi:anhydro-N-acetylmuramic acid kinase
MSLFLGLMSGTSLDGIDGVAVQWQRDDTPALRVLAHVNHAFDGALRGELMALNSPGPDELERAARAGIALAQAYAGVVGAVLQQAGIGASQVRALGAHGQTVRHRPDAPAGGYSIQLLNGAVLAERCGIDVVCDLRSRDLAAGGQGAPLVPAFHADRFGAAGEARAVLNLGGIANLTLLHPDGRVGGFDCGPGNVLLDLWAARHRGDAFDEGGRWAASGTVDARLLHQLLAEPYFQRVPPKSTGRDLFHAAWLDAQLARCAAAVAAVDVQATLAELTARTATDALHRHLSAAHELIVCGGGAFNAHLMARLAALLPQLRVQSSDAHGLPAPQVEAVAFAWLAREFVERRSGNRPEVTGASGPRVLGCLHPAGAR